MKEHIPRTTMLRLQYVITAFVVWYQVSKNDNAIPPDAEGTFAKQINATTISLASTHASYVSHPNEIAKLILDAANTLTRGGE